MTPRDRIRARAALTLRIDAAIERNRRQPERLRGGIPYPLQDADEYLRGICLRDGNARRGRDVCEALLDAIDRGEDVLTCRLARPALPSRESRAELLFQGEML